MAITNTCIRLLLWAKQHGASMETLLTLGRLENQTDRKSIEVLGKNKTVLFDIEKINWDNKYADSMFSALGSKTIDSLDYSDYEHATFHYDLNLPLPATLDRKYSIIIDGGTLEHVFNFPQAIKNCMKALAISGHFIGFSPANNLMGHGLYQFSPELFYRVFSKENGFHIKGIFIVAADFTTDAEAWYNVTDPKEMNERVTLQNKLPAYLMIVAEKITDIEPFTHPPLQSDYVSKWRMNSVGDQIAKTQPKPRLIRRLIRRIFFRPIQEEKLDKLNPQAFKKMKRQD